MAGSPVLLNSIPALTPMGVVPKHRTRATAPLAFLETINTIGRDGVTYFVLDVYPKHYTSSNTTTADSSPTITRKYCKDEPDYQLEKRFSDFADLRYSVWVYAQKEYECKCAYCDEFLDFIVHSMAQPRLLVKLATTTGMRKKLLATFCNEFLRIAMRGKRDAAHSDCEVLQATPVLMERFLRKPEGPR